MEVDKSEPPVINTDADTQDFEDVDDQEDGLMEERAAAAEQVRQLQVDPIAHQVAEMVADATEQNVARHTLEQAGLAENNPRPPQRLRSFIEEPSLSPSGCSSPKPYESSMRVFLISVGFSTLSYVVYRESFALWLIFASFGVALIYNWIEKVQTTSRLLELKYREHEALIKTRSPKYHPLNWEVKKILGNEPCYEADLTEPLKSVGEGRVFKLKFSVVQATIIPNNTRVHNNATIKIEQSYASGKLPKDSWTSKAVELPIATHHYWIHTVQHIEVPFAEDGSKTFWIGLSDVVVDSSEADKARALEPVKYKHATTTCTLFLSAVEYLE